MGTAPVQIPPPGIWLFGRCAEYILSSHRQEGLGSFHFSYFCLLATPTSWKLLRVEGKKKQNNSKPLIFYPSWSCERKCSPGWSAAQKTTQEGSVAAHRQPHSPHAVHTRMDFSSPGPSERATTADHWLVATPLPGPSLGMKSPFPCCVQHPPPLYSAWLGDWDAPPQHYLGNEQSRQWTWPGRWCALQACHVGSACPLESHLPLSKEPQSRQSSWFHFSSFSSEIINVSAAGRAGHVAGVCSAWPGTVPSLASSPSPFPILGFLTGAAEAIAWAMRLFFIFTLLSPWLS